MIVTGVGVYVYGLDMHFCANKICWTDTIGKRIECSNYMGGERRQVHNTTGKPWGLAIQGGVAYYTTGTPNSVWSVPLTGGNPTILDTGTLNTTKFYSIAILHRDHNRTVTGIRE
ncbi:hypothetical protein NP493_319g00011 [Ridgeia piscesae]|uniref:Uncharacterized protein n=1 Tax=Ridgeia piscesae TaxID=27915 RepID=A0AAD9NVY1_RIDPI|nr:hypothetical protein NP493_319g00011 [Ridgeia piscesae]